MLSRSPTQPAGNWQSFYAVGRDAWPTIALSETDLARHLDRISPVSAATGHAAELYLACGCALGIPAAIRAFERTYVADVPAMLTGLSLSESAIDDVTQRLRQRLLVASPEGVPGKIASYAGEGSLHAWVRVVARRIALSELQSARPSEPLAELEAPELPPELRYLKDRYQDIVRSAMEQAFAGLPTQQRTALRMHFLQRVPCEQLGVVFRVHRTTVSRWIEEACQTILDATRRQLRDQLTLDPEEADSLLGALGADLELSIARLLASRPPSATPASEM